MVEEVQEPLQKLSTEDKDKGKETGTDDGDDDDDYAIEPPLARRTTFGGASKNKNKNNDYEADEEDITPEPVSSLSRASSEPIGIGSPKSPFRQKRRSGRKSLRQQNPNHKLHSFLPPEMQESEATDEVSALTRAKEQRK
ncbi:MAG: hypothetical protein SGBAC_009707, partial [Bacillariaceae sp.]